MELLVPEQHKSEDDNGKHDAKHNCVCAHQGRVHSQVLLKKIAKAILVKKFYRIVFRGGGRVTIPPPFSERFWKLKNEKIGADLFLLCFQHRDLTV